MSSHGTPRPMTGMPSGPLRGVAEVPGDKSVSHRSLILGSKTNVGDIFVLLNLMARIVGYGSIAKLLVVFFIVKV